VSHEYVVRRGTPELIGRPSGDWGRASVARIDRYPWGGSGVDTSVRLLYDDEALYLQSRAADAPSASVTELNGPVSAESCVELFLSADGNEYVNFEANALGTVLLGVGPDRERRERIGRGPADRIRVRTSYPGGDSAGVGWWLAAALPFDVLASFAGIDPPSGGTAWRGNFYRCGPDGEHAVWKPTGSDYADFHRPDAFGRLAFEG
jgi:hypothetical protein